MIKILKLYLLIFAIATTASAQTNEGAYIKTLTDRAEKIVKTLSISDTAAFRRVTGIMVNQYKSLGKIHDGRDAAIKAAKAKAGQDKGAAQLAETTLQNEANAQLYNLHCEFIGALSGNLTEKQIEQVKDGMTFGVLPLTYKAYQEMIPTLKADEKRQIYVWLAEAREHAMDAQSSNKKHEWFGKYKGRINNYLSKQGYDSQKERQGWEDRTKKATTGTTK